MRFGVGVRFPVPGQLFLVGKAFARSLVGAGSVGKVALSGKASARYAWRSGLGSVPVITTTSFTLGTNPGFDALIGHVDATNSPTSYAITSGNASGAFAIYPSANLRTALSVAPPDNVYNLTITASNGFGTSLPATIAVTVGAAPVIGATSFNLSLPAVSGTSIGTVAASGGTPTSYALTAGNAAGYFAIDNSGNITVTPTGATGLTAQTYNLTVQASNAIGANTGSISVIAAASAGGYNNLTNWPDASNRPTLSGLTLAWIGPIGGGPSTANDASQSLDLDSSGGITASTPGQIISGLKCSGAIIITANNVTIRQCAIASNATACIDINPGVTGTLIEDCFIDGLGTQTFPNGGFNIRQQGNGSLTTRRCQMVRSGNAWNITGLGPSLLVDNYAWNMQSGGGPHYDQLQADGGLSNLTVSHNTLVNEQSQTSVTMIDNGFGPVSNVSIDNNRLIGGGYTSYFDQTFQPFSNALSGVSYTNNRIGIGAFGYLYCGMVQPTTFTGNVDDATGLPISLSSQPFFTGSFTIAAGAAVGSTVGTLTQTGGVQGYTLRTQDFNGVAYADSTYFSVTSAGVVKVAVTPPAGTYRPVISSFNAVGAYWGRPTITVPAASGSFSDSDWSSTANRPQFNSSTNVLTWVGPAAGGANDGSPVQQSLTLTNSSGVTTTANGQVITGLNLTGGITIKHNDVVIKRNRYRANSQGFAFTIAANVTGLVIEDNLIDGGKNSYEGICSLTVNLPPLTQYKMLPTRKNYIRRNYITGFENHITLSNGDSNVEISDNYLTAAGNSGSPSYDGDMIELYWANDVTIQHNVFDGANSQTNNIILNSLINLSNNAAVTNITINGNMFANGNLCNAFLICDDARMTSATISWKLTNNGFFNKGSKAYRISQAPDPSPNSGNYTATTITATSGTLINGSGAA